jgi:hypothetical protein
MRKSLWQSLTRPQQNRLKEGAAIVPPEDSDDPDLNNLYLNRRGVGRQVRLEYELLTVEDVRWIAVELSQMAKALADIAWESDADPLTKVILARRALYTAKRYGPRKRARKPRRDMAAVVKEVRSKN